MVELAINEAKPASVCTQPVGAGAAAEASAANVPVNGAALARLLNGLVLVELITVLVKLSPEPPLWFIKFITLPLGDFKKTVRSASQVWVILSVTLTVLNTVPAGAQLTFSVLVIPSGASSVIVSAIAPEAVLQLAGVGVITVNKVGSPWHKVAPWLAKIVNAPIPGITVNVAVAELTAAQPVA